MKNQLLFLALCLLSLKSFSQNPFTCGSYISRQLETSNNNVYKTQIDSVQIQNGISTLTPKLTLTDNLLNAIDYYGDYIWAWKQYANTNRSGGGGEKLLKIGKTGVVATYNFTTMEGEYNAAAIDANGVYYNVEPQGSGATKFTINRINLVPSTPIMLTDIVVNLPANMTWSNAGSGDLVFLNSILYIYINDRGFLKVNLTNGTSTRNYTNGSDTTRLVGSLYIDAGDVANIYGYGTNPGGGSQTNVLGINIFTGSVLDITLNGLATAQSDGASCQTGSIFTLTLRGNHFDDANGNTIIDNVEKGIKGPGNSGVPCPTCPAINSYVALIDNLNKVTSVQTLKYFFL